MTFDDLTQFLNAHEFKPCSVHSLPDQGMESRVEAFSNGRILIRVVVDRGQRFIDLANIQTVDWKSVFDLASGLDSSYCPRTGSFSEAIRVLVKYWAELSSANLQ